MNRNFVAALITVIMVTMLPLRSMGSVEETTDPADLVIREAPDLRIRKSDGNVRTVMIINSYYSSSPIPPTLLKPILMRVAQEPDLCCDAYYLNGHLINDSTTYNHVVKNFMMSIENANPQYIVMIGKIAFTLRDKIKERFGDIPILLLAQTDYYADIDYYYSGQNAPADTIQKHPLAELRDDYNFTTVIWPDYYEQTVDLIVKMRPEIKKLVFVSDGLFHNRIMSHKIRDYLLEHYPGIKFEWLPATYENSEIFQQYLSQSNPTIGLLLSSWSYGDISRKGYLQEWSDELNLIFASSTPVFCYNEAFMNYGAVGGAFVDITKIQNQVAEIFDKMLKGESMRDLPFYTNFDDFNYVVSYPLLKEYKMSAKDCPDGTIFYDKPASLWSQYHWEILAITVIVLTAMFMLWKRSQNQQHKIKILNRHRDFISKMPIPFSKAEIKFNKNGTVNHIEYTMKNEAFQKLIDENSDKVNDYILFPKYLINGKVEDVVKSHEMVKFTHRFEKTDSYFDIILSFTNDGSIRSNTRIVELDIFAIDLSERIKLENEMKELTRNLDLTINVAKIIPWYWDLKTDKLRFDAYSIFERQSHTFVEDTDQTGRLKTDGQNDANGVQCLIDVMDEFFPLIHPEDLEKLSLVREDLFSGRTKQVKMRYRLHIVRDGKDCYQWVEIRGQVVETDEKGNPKLVAGAMWQLDDMEEI